MTGPIDTKGLWKCCGGERTCGREVNKSKDGDTCPDCTHTRCSSCEKIEQPTPVRDEQDCQHQYVDDYHPGEYIQQLSDCSDHYYFDYDFQVGASADDLPPMQHENIYHPVEHPRRRPSMRGWWHCCQCGADVNPQINSWTCPVCFHGKCDYDCFIHQQ